MRLYVCICVYICLGFRVFVLISFIFLVSFLNENDKQNYYTHIDDLPSMGQFSIMT